MPGQCLPGVDPYFDPGQGLEVVQQPAEELQVVPRDDDPQRPAASGEPGRCGGQRPFDQSPQPLGGPVQ